MMPSEPYASYIGSKYHRAPELIFGATEYAIAFDMWSAGCLVVEHRLGQLLFLVENGVDQLVEIIKIMGTPTMEETKCMNPGYNEFKPLQINAHHHPILHIHHV